jgi:hypothetical protein
MTTTYNPNPTTDTSTFLKVSTQIELEPVDLREYEFAPGCDRCGAEATIVGQGCGDSAPVLLCDKCLERGVEAIQVYVRTWQRDNKQVMICNGCYRPVLSLDTHLEVKRLNPSG